MNTSVKKKEMKNNRDKKEKKMSLDNPIIIFLNFDKYLFKIIF
jgi:hypothetical protein